MRGGLTGAWQSCRHDPDFLTCALSPPASSDSMICSQPPCLFPALILALLPNLASSSLSAKASPFKKQ